jgi:hypothetical protein
MPRALAVGTDGYAYVYDVNQRIQKFGGGPTLPVGFTPPGVSFGVWWAGAPGPTRSVT